MNTKKIAEELHQKYPGKNVVINNAYEVICEVQPSAEEGIAVAVIQKSLPHYHKVITETYEVIKGELTLFCNDKKHILKEGEKFTVKPGQIHYAEGNETWIKCYSKPGWTPKDHFLT